jgi:ariadne-1
MEVYFDGDQEKLFKDARVINPFRETSEATGIPSGSEECTICLLSNSPSLMTGLQCGHRFCTKCWAEYLTTKITQEGMGESISCAAHNCEILVDDATVMRLISDARVRTKYQHLITNSFVEVILTFARTRASHR